MTESYFEVQEYTTIGVDNVPTAGEAPVCIFFGTVTPKYIRLEDANNINAIDIDFEITSQEYVNVKVNNYLREMATDIKYRVVKVFHYQGPVTKIWAATGEEA